MFIVYEIKSAISPSKCSGSMWRFPFSLYILFDIFSTDWPHTNLVYLHSTLKNVTGRQTTWRVTRDDAHELKVNPTFLKVVPDRLQWKFVLWKWIPMMKPSILVFILVEQFTESILYTTRTTRRIWPGFVNAASKLRHKWQARAVTQFTKPGRSLLVVPCRHQAK